MMSRLKYTDPLVRSSATRLLGCRRVVVSILTLKHELSIRVVEAFHRE